MRSPLKRVALALALWVALIATVQAQATSVTSGSTSTTLSGGPPTTQVPNTGQTCLTDTSGRCAPFPIIQSDNNIVFKGYTSDGTLQTLLAYQTNQAGKGNWNFNTGISMGGTIAMNGFALTNVPRVSPTSGVNLILGTGAALATTATSGFVLVPSGSGVPTGAPVGSAAGATPMYVDLSNLKLCFYIGAVWRCTAALN